MYRPRTTSCLFPLALIFSFVPTIAESQTQNKLNKPDILRERNIKPEQVTDSAVLAETGSKTISLASINRAIRAQFETEASLLDEKALHSLRFLLVDRALRNSQVEHIEPKLEPEASPVTLSIEERKPGVIVLSKEDEVLARKLVRQLKKDPSNFMSTAEEHSIRRGSPSRRHEFNFVTQNQLPSELSETLFQLEIGEISKAIESEERLVILKLLEVRKHELSFPGRAIAEKNPLPEEAIVYID